jgi:hypothetical protein
MAEPPDELKKKMMKPTLLKMWMLHPEFLNLMLLNLVLINLMFPLTPPNIFLTPKSIRFEMTVSDQKLECERH